MNRHVAERNQLIRALTVTSNHPHRRCHRHHRRHCNYSYRPYRVLEHSNSCSNKPCNKAAPMLPEGLVATSAKVEEILMISHTVQVTWIRKRRSVDFVFFCYCCFPYCSCWSCRRSLVVPQSCRKKYCEHCLKKFYKETPAQVAAKPS